MPKEYKRIADLREYTFDSLETMCNELAQDGWEVMTISDGSVGRTATLVRDVDEAAARRQAKIKKVKETKNDL